MRLLERIVTTHLTGTASSIDTAARGARGAMVTLQPAGAGIVDRFTITERWINPSTGGDIVNTVARWYFDGIDSQQGSYVFFPLFGDRLSLSNESGGTVQSYVNLFDDGPPAAHGSFTRYLRANTLAALATFTVGAPVGRFGQTHWAVLTDRAATIFFEAITTTALTPILIQLQTIPGAAGGTSFFTTQFPSPNWQLRLRNDDAALLMTYTITAYVPPFVI